MKELAGMSALMRAPKTLDTIYMVTYTPRHMPLDTIYTPRYVPLDTRAFTSIWLTRNPEPEIRNPKRCFVEQGKDLTSGVAACAAMHDILKEVGEPTPCVQRACARGLKRCLGEKRHSERGGRAPLRNEEARLRSNMFHGMKR